MSDEPEPTRLEDWQLADLSRVDYKLIVRDETDELGTFFLGLAAAFNDLKGIVMFETFLISKGRPASGTISPYAGQWHGTLVQVHRWIAGFMYELMIWIRESPKTVLLGKELAALVGKLPPKLQKLWRELVPMPIR